MESKLTPGYYYQPLFDLLNQEHGIIPLESEMADIITIVEKMQHLQQKEDAVVFAEWIRESGIEPTFGNRWVDFSKPKDNRYTTAELYELFKQQKEKQ